MKYIAHLLNSLILGFFFGCGILISFGVIAMVTFNVFYPSIIEFISKIN